MRWSVLVSIGVLLITGVTLDAEAQTRVEGYFRRDGTYVQPYYRTQPDSNPYNNYSFPGNYNPNTGRVTPGNPDTSLRNYYEQPTLPQPPRQPVEQPLFSYPLQRR